MPHPFLASSRVPAFVSGNFEATEAGVAIGGKSGDKHSDRSLVFSEQRSKTHHMLLA